ncbi:DUF3108 domain-containing protein [Azospirillum agricola]|uniref:DUF3108 domain-containing protein n=1 Tax=Azospirillum agricola TaxID=1720247 RepID=UPI000A0F1BD9|nr:DUF3108 domain-containing protein [Azospirillum agricola]SMH58517.1 Protein of unknown function [Azospirillum lipoferum]
MTSPLPVRRPRAAALAVALLALPSAGLLGASAPARAAEPLAATYRLHIGGLAVLDIVATLEMGDQSYRMEVKAQTEGFLNRLFPWQTVSRSDGAVRGGRLVPAHHSQSSVFREKPRSVTLEYDGQGNVAATVLPTPQEDGREPVPDAERQATYDPLSAFLTVLAASARGEACTRSLPVFDGRRRYDMQFQDVGPRLVGASRYSIFSGTARQCRVSYRPVAGYARTAPGNGFWQRNGAAAERPPADLWLAPVVPGQPPLPVRLETDSDLGAVVIHLTGVTPPDGTPSTGTPPAGSPSAGNPAAPRPR